MDLFVDARYSYQVWNLEVSLPQSWWQGQREVWQLQQAFDEAHQRVFAVAEPGARVECLMWKARVRSPIGLNSIKAIAGLYEGGTKLGPRLVRPAYFDDGWVETPIYTGDKLPVGSQTLGTGDH